MIELFKLSEGNCEKLIKRLEESFYVYYLQYSNNNNFRVIKQVLPEKIKFKIVENEILKFYKETVRIIKNPIKKATCNSIINYCFLGTTDEGFRSNDFYLRSRYDENGEIKFTIEVGSFDKLDIVESYEEAIENLKSIVLNKLDELEYLYKTGKARLNSKLKQLKDEETKNREG